MYCTHHYIIDWSKIKSQDDIITILKSMNLSFEDPNEEMEKLCKIVQKKNSITFCDSFMPSVPEQSLIDFVNEQIDK